MSPEQSGIVKFVMYQDCVSPHQVPLAREIVATLGEGDFRYVYRDWAQSNRVDMGWTMVGAASWFLHIGTDPEEATSQIENADCLLTMFRDVELFKRRHANGLRTFVQTERWLKPRCGILRLLSLSYRRMAREFVRLMDEGGVVYLPIGIHAARDMARLCGLMHGDWRCLFRAPTLEFEHKPGGKIFSRVERVDRVEWERKHCLDKMRMWGYFVESSEFGVKSSELKEEELESSEFGVKSSELQKGSLDQTHNSQLTTHNSQLTTHNSLKVLWVGRLLHLKRVDTIIQAVGYLSNLSTPQTSQTSQTPQTSQTLLLDIYGSGPEEARLKKMAAKYGDAIKFHPPVPIAEVRKLMREHDVYVMSSNAYEGWGAVVSEALEEGMRVLGTYEAGACATILSEDDLFHADDWGGLARVLNRCMDEKQRAVLRGQGIGLWTASEAARRLLSEVGATEENVNC